MCLQAYVASASSLPVTGHTFSGPAGLRQVTALFLNSVHSWSLEPSGDFTSVGKISRVRDIFCFCIGKAVFFQRFGDGVPCFTIYSLSVLELALPSKPRHMPGGDLSVTSELILLPWRLGLTFYCVSLALGRWTCKWGLGSIVWFHPQFYLFFFFSPFIFYFFNLFYYFFFF